MVIVVNKMDKSHTVNRLFYHVIKSPQLVSFSFNRLVNFHRQQLPITNVKLVTELFFNYKFKKLKLTISIAFMHLYKSGSFPASKHCDNFLECTNEIKCDIFILHLNSLTFQASAI